MHLLVQASLYYVADSANWGQLNDPCIISVTNGNYFCVYYTYVCACVDVNVCDICIAESTGVGS